MGLQRTDEWSEVTWARPNVAQGDDRGVVCLGDLGNGTGLVMTI